MTECVLQRADPPGRPAGRDPSPPRRRNGGMPPGRGERDERPIEEPAAPRNHSDVSGQAVQ